MRVNLDHCRDPDLLAAEVRRLQAVIAASNATLTDAERAAIETAALALQDLHVGCVDVAATLRNLLERLK